MLRFALLRILGAIPTLLVVIAVAFMLVHAAPGGPFDSERVLLPEVEQNILRAYHLDEPLPQQFSRYLRGVLRGDFGPSYTHPEYGVSEIIYASYPVSFLLGAWSLAIASWSCSSRFAWAGCRRALAAARVPVDSSCQLSCWRCRSWRTSHACFAPA